jgi:hypothetical protein
LSVKSLICSIFLGSVVVFACFVKCCLIVVVCIRSDSVIGH